MHEASSDSPCGGDAPRGRWPFIRDVLLLQVKLLLGNLHNLILIPATTVAALLDLLFRSGSHGSRFYRVLGWGRRADEAIDLYGALNRYDSKLNDGLTVDAIVSRLEGAIIHEFKRGETTAAVKSAVARALDRLHLRPDD